MYFLKSISCGGHLELSWLQKLSCHSSISNDFSVFHSNMSSGSLDAFKQAQALTKLSYNKHLCNFIPVFFRTTELILWKRPVWPGILIWSEIFSTNYKPCQLIFPLPIMCFIQSDAKNNLEMSDLFWKVSTVDFLNQCRIILILQAYCPATFRRFSAPTDLIKIIELHLLHVIKFYRSLLGNHQFESSVLKQGNI